MTLKQRFAAGVVATVGIIGLLAFFAHRGSDAILDPQGPIAEQQRQLIITAALLSLIVIIPVFILTFVIAWKYRESNPKKAKYTPDWDHSHILETIWWTIPLLLITVLAVITWTSTHDLEPSKALASSKKPLTVQVVALDWKWLFIYPEQDVATVNFLQIPEDRPINFQITSDAPMNSFWIPQLGGQIYAMAGMSTQLHLQADTPGDYRGSSANLSGEGFAGMHFMAHATTESDFAKWTQAAKKSPQTLDWDSYTKLAEPSENNPRATYKTDHSDLYNRIIMKYMSHHETADANTKEGAE